jgi:hypothetical protein
MKLLIKTILVVSKLFALLNYCLSFQKPTSPPVVESPYYTEPMCTLSIGPTIEGILFVFFLFIGLPFALGLGALLFLSPVGKPSIEVPATLNLK